MRPRLARTVAAEGWGVGKWLFATQLTLSLQSYVAYWLLGLLLGVAATGTFAACMSIVLICNPLTMGLCNVLAPSATLALEQGGLALLRREVLRDTAVLASAMAVFCLVVLFGGDYAMSVLFAKREYAGHADILMVLSLSLLASAVGMPASNALASMKQPRAIFWCGLISLMLTVVLVTALVLAWGLFGAALGFLAGNIAGSAARWVAFAARTSEADLVGLSAAEGISAAQRVLQRLIGESGDALWAYERKDSGCQADVVLVTRTDGGAVWGERGASSSSSTSRWRMPRRQSCAGSPRRSRVFMRRSMARRAAAGTSPFRARCI